MDCTPHHIYQGLYFLSILIFFLPWSHTLDFTPSVFVFVEARSAVSYEIDLGASGKRSSFIHFYELITHIFSKYQSHKLIIHHPYDYLIYSIYMHMNIYHSPFLLFVIHSSIYSFTLRFFRQFIDNFFLKQLCKYMAILLQPFLTWPQVRDRKPLSVQGCLYGTT
jgi:hypothetical protein